MKRLILGVALALSAFVGFAQPLRMDREQMLKEIKDRYIKQEVMVPMRDGVKLHTSVRVQLLSLLRQQRL